MLRRSATAEFTAAIKVPSSDYYMYSNDAIQPLLARTALYFYYTFCVDAALLYRQHPPRIISRLDSTDEKSERTNGR